MKQSDQEWHASGVSMNYMHSVEHPELVTLTRLADPVPEDGK